jgi:hypothetical protein
MNENRTMKTWLDRLFHKAASMGISYADMPEIHAVIEVALSDYALCAVTGEQAP